MAKDLKMTVELIYSNSNRFGDVQIDPKKITEIVDMLNNGSGYTFKPTGAGRWYKVFSGEVEHIIGKGLVFRAPTIGVLEENVRMFDLEFTEAKYREL